MTARTDRILAWGSPAITIALGIAAAMISVTNDRSVPIPSGAEISSDADRLAALGGEPVVPSAPGGGTGVAGSVPVGGPS